VVMVDRDEAALKTLCNKHGDAVIPLVIDLLDPRDCATLLPRVLEKAGQLDILHANAGTYVGGDLVDSDTGATHESSRRRGSAGDEPSGEVGARDIYPDDVFPYRSPARFERYYVPIRMRAGKANIQSRASALQVL
jgi:NAD(P)-dependent dehydrogenase (short-subunit alcohol dehydrogenase family)